MQKLIIVGAGGAGIECWFVAARMAGVWEMVGFCDDSPALKGKSIEGGTVLDNTEGVLARYHDRGVFFHCALGRNEIRQRVAARFEAAGFLPATLVDPTAVTAASAEIGAGTYIGPLAWVGPASHIGRHVLINVGASVGHNNQVGDFAQICPGARLSGGTVVGEGAFIGSNAVTVPLARVGEWATLGAASLAARDVPARVTAIGVPAVVRAPATRP
jgi:sugar O-acyltransferase (sialic acid O-acetyltransferase NeuD family)